VEHTVTAERYVQYKSIIPYLLGCDEHYGSTNTRQSLIERKPQFITRSRTIEIFIFMEFLSDTGFQGGMVLVKFFTAMQHQS